MEPVIFFKITLVLTFFIVCSKIEEDTNNNNDKSTSLLMRVEQLKLMAEIEVLTSNLFVAFIFTTVVMRNFFQNLSRLQDCWSIPNYPN